MIDVDNLNFINDTYGHMIGDMILLNLASIIKEELQDDNLVARIGGDEFAVLLHGLTLDEAKQVGEKLRSKVEKEKFYPYHKELLINYTISVGISQISKGGMDLKGIINRADYALHRSKELGRNCISSITDEEAFDAGLDEINNLISSIRDAIISKNFKLYFQPIVDVVTGEIVHYEGLMRIIDKNNEIIYPGRAIPVAERFGLMTFIDKHIIKLAFEALASYPEIKLFINLSGSSIGDPEILSLIKEGIKEKGISPSRIGFEITETMAVKELASADRWINNLRELGCKFALDDFGIGFSTFSYLQYLSVDYVKIDGSYIHDIEINNKNRALVQAINTVAKSFGKKVIAEFVENSCILNILKEDNIGFAQGYYFGKPQPYPQTV